MVKINSAREEPALCRSAWSLLQTQIVWVPTEGRSAEADSEEKQSPGLAYANLQVPVPSAHSLFFFLN